ncbi:MAG: SDR family NAD(P)-dependent oxidoreductase, partial [Myxococcales bacterium]|nr:SDR family NAD(P)-dependent oxidoreductase [Myxococcales bacterium]
MKSDYRHALIVGAGAGLSASLARLFHKNGLKVSLAARGIGDLAGLAAETKADVHTCDAGDHEAVADLFDKLDANGAPDVLVYNPSG